MELKECSSEDIEFYYECLKDLRGDVNYSIEEFRQFMVSLDVSQSCLYSKFLVGFIEGQPVGILTCNWFAMPRYIGFGVELEEVVVFAPYRGRGIARKMISSFVGQCQEDPSIRKIAVKTDDPAAQSLYTKFFDKTNLSFFSRKNVSI